MSGRACRCGSKSHQGEPVNVMLMTGQSARDCMLLCGTGRSGFDARYVGGRKVDLKLCSEWMSGIACNMCSSVLRQTKFRGRCAVTEVSCLPVKVL